MAQVNETEYAVRMLAGCIEDLMGQFKSVFDAVGEGLSDSYAVHEDPGGLKAFGKHDSIGVRLFRFESRDNGECLRFDVRSEDAWRFVDTHVFSVRLVCQNSMLDIMESKEIYLESGKGWYIRRDGIEIRMDSNWIRRILESALS